MQKIMTGATASAASDDVLYFVYETARARGQSQRFVQKTDVAGLFIFFFEIN